MPAKKRQRRQGASVIGVEIRDDTGKVCLLSGVDFIRVSCVLHILCDCPYAENGTKSACEQYEMCKKVHLCVSEASVCVCVWSVWPMCEAHRGGCGAERLHSMMAVSECGVG